MGGGAFRQALAEGHPTLNIPRMTPDEYDRLKQIYLTKIQNYFPGCNVKVAVLTEAPEKQDYGDMDLFIGSDEPVHFLDLGDKVGATAVIVYGTGCAQQCSFGVRKDGLPSSEPVIKYGNVHGRIATPDEVTETEYAQIDVDVVPTELFDWYTFYSGCGDMNGLLGHIVTNLGFKVTHQGFWLRMKELDASKAVSSTGISDAEGLMRLSSDPDEVMRFLGLSVERYHAGFTTMKELYEWLGECKLLHPETWKLRRDKAHERKREMGRPVYARFFFEWLPANMPDWNWDIDPEERAEISQRWRDQHLEEALEFFDIRAEYETRHTALALKLRNAIAANLIRPFIWQYSSASGASAKRQGEIMRGFHLFVKVDEEGEPSVATTAHSLEKSELHRLLDEDGGDLRDREMVEEFVKLKWDQLRRLVKSSKGQADAPAALMLSNTTAADLIRPFVAQELSKSGMSAKRLGEIMRGFHRFVTVDKDGQPGVATTAHSLEDSELHRLLDAEGTALRDEEKVREFVVLKWAELRVLAKSLKRQVDGDMDVGAAG